MQKHLPLVVFLLTPSRRWSGSDSVAVGIEDRLFQKKLLIVNPCEPFACALTGYRRKFGSREQEIFYHFKIMHLSRRRGEMNKLNN
jgi:hypothetical protein